MVGGAVPLFVNVGVAALASFRLHEIFRGDVTVVPGLRGTGEELALRAVAFAVHGGRGHLRIDDAIGVSPDDFAGRPRAGRNTCRGQEQTCKSKNPLRCGGPKPTAGSQPRGGDEKRADDAERDMRIKPGLEAVGRADENQRDAEHGTGGER